MLRELRHVCVAQQDASTLDAIGTIIYDFGVVRNGALTKGCVQKKGRVGDSHWALMYTMKRAGNSAQ
jgi:hypothetical protein